MRRWFFGISLAALVGAHGAHAQTPLECIDAHRDGQLALIRGRLHDAEEKFAVCSAAPCPGKIRSECVDLASRAQSQHPTVTLEVRESDGSTVANFGAFVDGIAVTKVEDGSLAIDPGPHALRVELSDGRAASQEVVVVRGEKQKRVLFRLAPRPASEPAATAPATAPAEAPPANGMGASSASRDRNGARSTPVEVFVAGGLALVGTASFATFGALGRSKESSLDACKGTHTCAHDDVQKMYTEYAVADVSLGVAVVALAVGAVLYWASRGEPTRATVTLSPRRLATSLAASF
jgi:hypothetical protein